MRSALIDPKGEYMKTEKVRASGRLEKERRQ